MESGEAFLITGSGITYRRNDTGNNGLFIKAKEEQRGGFNGEGTRQEA